jgi:hypothetical protein
VYCYVWKYECIATFGAEVYCYIYKCSDVTVGTQFQVETGER